MKRKVIYLALLSILIGGILLNTSHQMFIWGFETISGGDELAHFSRARAIAFGYVDLYHEYDVPQYYDFYPSGFHISLASFMILSDTYSPYEVSFIFKAMFSIVTTILVFLLGAKINKNIGLFSAFFYITFFRVFTSSQTHYIYINSTQNYLSSNFITQITVIMALLLVVDMLKKQVSTLHLYGGLLTFVSAVHGISHISTYIGFMANFTGVLLFLLVISILKYRTVQNKLLHALFYIFISLPIIFFIYYYPMYPDITTSAYLPEKFFPSFVPISLISYFPYILAFLFIALLAVYIVFLKFFHGEALSVRLPSRSLIFFMFIYILLYASVLFFVTRNPSKYTFGGFIVVMGVFPTYLTNNMGFVSMASLSAGFSMFVLTVWAFLKVEKVKNTRTHLILVIYFVFYSIWFVFVFVIHYYADRIIYIEFVLPIIYGMGLAAILGERNIFGKEIRPIFRRLAVFGIVLFVAFISVGSQISKEPQVRPDLITNETFIGSPTPPRTISSFSYVLEEYTNPGEYILGSPETLEVMASTTHVRSPANHWSQTRTDNGEFSLTISAIRGLRTSDFFERYNARYMAVSYKDINIGEDHYTGDHKAPIDRYDSSPNFHILYVDQYGERMYIWTK